MCENHDESGGAKYKVPIPYRTTSLEDSMSYVLQPYKMELYQSFSKQYNSDYN